MPSPSHDRKPVVNETIAWVARGLTCLLLLFAPWPYAMAEWSSQVWLVPWVGAILLLASVVALVGRLSVGNPLTWSLIFVLTVGFIQITPIPESLWNRLAFGAGFEQELQQLTTEFGMPPQELPATPGSDATQLATDEVGNFPPARTLSIHPLQTRATLCVMAMGLAMLVASTILFRDRLGVAMLLGVMAISGVAISLAGIYQVIVPGDWVILPELPKVSSFATFFSRNSAPQFLACTFAATGGLMALYRTQVKKQRRDKRYQIVYPSVNIAARLRRRAEDFFSEADLYSILLLVALVLQAVGVLVANSRGGILAFGASVAIVLLIYSFGRQVNVSVTLAVMAMIIGVALFLSFYGLDESIGRRLETISREAYQLDNARLELWRMALSQPTIWLLGSGLGTFHFAILPEYAQPLSTWFYHSENIYIELASNAGLVTLLIALTGLLWLLWQLLSRVSHSNTERATRLACLFGVLAVGLHNMVDFSLMLPAIFLPVSCLCGAYLGTRQNANEKNRRSRRSTRSTHKSLASREGEIRSVTVSAQVKQLDRDDIELGNAPSPGEPLWSPLALVVCLLIISAAVMAGYRPLAAFAFAEKLHAADSLEKEVDPARVTFTDDAKEAQQRIDRLVQSIEESSQARGARFPEARMQIGRWRQELASEQLENSPNWPEEMSLAMRRSLASPEFFTTALHEMQDPELASLSEFVEQESAVLANLAASNIDMQSALAACPLDWRASWGWLRSDLGESSDLQRRRNYARLLLTCRCNLRVLQAAGTHALMTGQVTAGQRIWQQLLPVSGLARNKVVRLTGRFLSIPQLIAILPENPLLKIEMAKAAENLPEGGEAGKSIVQTIDLQEAFATARYASDWPQVAWCANRQGNLEGEISAWRNAVADDLLNEKMNFALAQVLEKAGRFEEALEQVEIALEKAPDNAAYLALKNELFETVQD